MLQLLIVLFITGMILSGIGLIIGYLRLLLDMIQSGDYLWATTLIGLTLILISIVLWYGFYYIPVKELGR